MTTPTWSTLSIDTTLALRTAAARPTDEFTGTFGPETIERFLHSSYDQFAQQGLPAQSRLSRSDSRSPASPGGLPHFLPEIC